MHQQHPAANRVARPLSFGTGSYNTPAVLLQIAVDWVDGPPGHLTSIQLTELALLLLIAQALTRRPAPKQFTPNTSLISIPEDWIARLTNSLSRSSEPNLGAGERLEIE